MLLTVSGLLVVLIGLRMWGVPFLRRISPELTRPCRFRGKAFAVGLLTGLMPCGALSSMWIFAASSGSWASGASFRAPESLAAFPPEQRKKKVSFLKKAQAARPVSDAPLGLSDFPGDHFPASVSQYRQR